MNSSIIQAKKGKTLFVLGDSISIHYGPYLKKNLNKLFNYDRKREGKQTLEDLDNPVGANGGDSKMILQYLREQSAEEFKHDILLLNCGLHDIKTCPKTNKKQVRIEEYVENLQEILTLLCEMGRNMVWINTTPVDDKQHNSKMKEFKRYNKDVVNYNKRADKLMRENKTPVIDLYSFTMNLGRDIYIDGAHFKDRIRKLQAAFIAGYLYTFYQERKT